MMHAGYQPAMYAIAMVVVNPANARFHGKIFCSSITSQLQLVPSRQLLAIYMIRDMVATTKTPHSCLSYNMVIFENISYKVSTQLLGRCYMHICKTLFNVSPGAYLARRFACIALQLMVRMLQMIVFMLKVAFHKSEHNIVK